MTRPDPSPRLTRRGLLGAGAGLAAGLAAPARADDAAAPLVVYAVRHAEKEREPFADPPLTAAGAARAEQLAAVLRDVPLRAVLSTDTVRTRATAVPAARGHGLEVTAYRPEPGALAGALAPGGAVLVVGHSNTIPALLRELGADGPAGDLEGFDDLFLLVRLPAPAGGEPPRPLLQRLHYGAPSPG